MLVSLSHEVERRWPNDFNCQNKRPLLSKGDCTLIKDNLLEAVFRAYQVPILFKLYKPIIRVIALKELTQGWNIVPALAQAFGAIQTKEQVMGLTYFVMALVACY